MEDPEVTKLQNLVNSFSKFYYLIIKFLQLTELSQSKAPIGKQQIVEVTKAAMTAIRHFKHVVHAVEKFILKVWYIVKYFVSLLLHFSANLNTNLLDFI